MSCKRGLLKIKLKVEVRDKHGKLIETREKEGDLILDNFKEILAVLLSPYFLWSDVIGLNITGVEEYASLVDIGGTARSVPIMGVRTVGTSDDVTINFLGASGYDLIYGEAFGVLIEIGTSTVSPTRGDYKLGAKVKMGTPTQTVGADYISWAVSLVLDAAADIAEAGLTLTCLREAVGAGVARHTFMLFRDTFTPISVPAGGTISVTYTLTL